MALPVHEILGLFRIRGAASLLHDRGHLLVERPQEMGREANDLHRFHPPPFLRGVFPDAVLESIRLHVEAKRYLCRADLEAKMFLARPYADCAVRLRHWDDLAKTPRKRTPDLEHYGHVLEACAFQAYASGTRWT